MLEYNILSRKDQTYKIEDDKKITFIDLLTPITDKYKDVKTYKTIVVSKDYVARPDLISLALYGDDKYADVICKVNGISNPFELNEDMVIFCPSYQEIQGLILNTVGTSDMMHDDENKTPSIAGYITKTSTISNDVDKKKKKQKNERRSPAEQTINDNNFVIDKSLGIVIY